MQTETNKLSEERENEILSAIRSFQRSYSSQLGLLNVRMDESEPYPLVEVRVLYEISNTPGCIASFISDTLLLDRSVVSRLLHKMEKHGLIRRVQSETDGRVYHLYTTPLGRKTLDNSISLSRNRIQARFVDKLSPKDTIRLGELLSEADDILRSIK